MVEAEQVQDAVGAQQLELVARRSAGGARLGGGDLRAEHDVPEQRRLGVVLATAGLARAQLVHRERHDVGRARLVHPLHVERSHRVGVDGDDRELGERVDPQPVEHEAGELGEPVDVDVGSGLVVHVDAHEVPIVALGAHLARSPAAAGEPALPAPPRAGRWSAAWVASHRP